MKTSLETIAEQLTDLGKICDGWGPEEECDQAATWQAMVRHVAPPIEACPPVTILLCDGHHQQMHLRLALMNGHIFSCRTCQRRDLVGPTDFLLSEGRL